MISKSSISSLKLGRAPERFRSRNMRISNSESQIVPQHESDNEYPNCVPQDVTVSVFMITYNQATFIAKAIDSVLMQETEFSFELCLGEDASSDGTREICLEYARKHPNRIRLFLRTREDVLFVDGFPTGHRNARKTFDACRGKYIAICEGDDYWTDKHKLQKQVEFLEEHDECALVFHSAYEYWGDQDSRNRVIAARYDHDAWVPARKVILGGGGFIPTPSIIYRRRLLYDDRPPFLIDPPVGDIVIQVVMAVRGKIRYMNSTMSVYRRNAPGSWSSMNQMGNKMILHTGRVLGLWSEIGDFVPWKLKGYVLLHTLFITLKAGSASNAFEGDLGLVDFSRVSSPWKRRILAWTYQLGKVLGYIRHNYLTRKM